MAVSVEEFINRRRRQILVHSYLYYRMNTNVIDDHTYDKWSAELASLQKRYPEVAENCVFADAFRDFDGSSGFDLPLHDPWVGDAAHRYLNAVKWKRENPDYTPPTK